MGVRLIDLADDCKSLMIRTALGSSRKLGGAAENLIDSSKKRICPLSFKSFEF